MINYIEFLMSVVRHKHFSVIISGHVRHLVLLHSDTLNPAIWWILLAVDSDIDRLPSFAESVTKALPRRDPLSLQEQFIESFPGVVTQSRLCPDCASDLVIIGILKFMIL